MYEELVKSLREADHIFSKAFVELGETLFKKAADAIEELEQRARPERVGFTEWKGIRDTRYKCPGCGKYVRKDESYCHKCGKGLIFPIISFTPYIPGEKQETIISWPDENKEETEHD